MVIKRGDGNAMQIRICIVAILYTVFEFGTLTDNLIEWLIPTLLCSMYFLCILRMIRTIYFTKDGCVISLLWFDKFYRWDEIKIKRIQRLGWYHTSEPYTKVVYFCSKRIHKFSWLKPNKYLLFPMSFFYVHFLPARPLTEREKKFPTDYAVDEKEFVAKMDEWGVELEEDERTAFL